MKIVHQKGLWGQIKKKFEFSLLSPDSRKLLTTTLNTLNLAMAEEDYLIFFTGEGEGRVERRLKKSQVTAEKLAQMFGVSHNAEALTVGSLSRDFKIRRVRTTDYGRDEN